MKHILIGRNLILNPDHIISANLSAKDYEGKPCIKVKVDDGTEWTIWANLEKSKQILISMAQYNDAFELVDMITKKVNESRRGVESKLSKEIKQLLDQ